MGIMLERTAKCHEQPIAIWEKSDYNESKYNGWLKMGRYIK